MAFILPKKFVESAWVLTLRRTHVIIIVPQKEEI